MESKKLSITATAIYLICSIAMVVISGYLINYYFEVIYPTGLATTSACDINSFLNCDTTSYSSISNIFGIPIATFGLLLGLFNLIGFVFSSQEFQKLNFLLLIANAIFCLLLLFYSLFFLKSLCPFCFLYYLFSWGALATLIPYQQIEVPQFKTLSIYALMSAVVLGITGFNVHKKEKRKNEGIAPSLISQFKELPRLEEPSSNSPYMLARATDDFTKAPVRITKFSDFQCGSCKIFSQILKKTARKYKGKISIQYLFYPLDHNCNPAIKNRFHALSCEASYLAYCVRDKFVEVEHDIFSNQKELSKEWLEEYAKRENVQDCVGSPETKKAIQEMIAHGEKLKVQSTPTFLLNGVKIEGALDPSRLYILIDYILTNE